MKRFLSRLAAVVPLLFLATVALAQVPPTAPVAQVPSRLDACTIGSTANGSAQQTLTLTPQSGQFLYVCGVDLEYCTGTSAVTAAAATTTTSTNLPNNPKYGVPVGTAATSCYNVVVTYDPPLKATAAGTPVTFVSPAAITNLTFNMNAYGYSAP